METINGIRVKLQVWDTCGQERFATITSSYFTNCKAILFLYDRNSQSSYDWIVRFLAGHSARLENRVVYLVATAIENSPRCISPEQGRSLAASYGLNYTELNDVNNLDQAEQLFESVATAALVGMQDEIAAQQQQNNPNPGNGRSIS